MCWRSGGAKASRRIRRRRREAPQVRSKIRRARRCGGVSCCLHSFARLPNPRWRAAISGSSAKTPRLADGILESPRATSGRGSAWLERLVRDQEVGGSNPLAPTNSFNNLQGLDDQTTHPTAHPVPKLLPDSFAPILRAWRRTLPHTPHRPLLPPANRPILALHSLPSSRSTFATSVARHSQRS